jgi:molybdopterin-guanine dinucleotide biosynthesis protein A
VITLGVVVAGGQGRRLGLGMPKALAPLRGVPLVGRAIATLAAVCDQVAVAAPAEVELPAGGALRVHDQGGLGPLAGCVAAFQALGHRRALVLGVDFPLIGSALLEALLAELQGSAAVVPAPGGSLQPLVAAYDRTATAFLTRRFEDGERSIVEAVRWLRPRVLDDTALEGLPGGCGAFLNVNTPADLALAEERLS